jgi:hypothetical protein
MFVRLQTDPEGKSAWKTVDAKDADEHRKSAYHMSVLACDVAEGTDEDFEKAKYSGDFPIDLDAPDQANFPEVIEELKRLLAFLVEQCEIPQQSLRIYASGVKGFHILVPETAIKGNKRPTPKLPQIYKALASRLMSAARVTHLDLGQYNAKKGSLLRVENKERVKNGKPTGRYKVPITYEEAQNATVEWYEQITRTPRIVNFDSKAVNQSPKMNALLLRAKEDVTKGRSATRAVALPLECLEGFSAHTRPACMEAVVNWDDVRSDLNTNDLRMQLGLYLKAVSASQDEIEEVARTWYDARLAFKKGKKSRQSFQEVLSTFRYLVDSSDMAFSCGAAKACVQNRQVCDGCPVVEKQNHQVGRALGIVQTKDGYVRINQEGELVRQICDFTMRPREVIKDEYTGSTSPDNVKFINFDLVQNGERIGTTRYMTMSELLTLREFKEAVLINWRLNVDTRFEEDLKDLRKYLFTQMESAVTMKLLDTAGVTEEVLPSSEGDIKVRFYAENGMVVSSEGLSDMAVLRQEVPNIACLHKLPMPSKNHEGVNKTLGLLLDSNRPYIVGQILGWMCACHLKTHLMRHTGNEFPLLHIYGRQTSGKTMTSRIYSAIACADYSGPKAPPSVCTTSAIPLKLAASSTTTIPRIFDEANATKMDPKRWLVVEGLLKAAYQQQSAEIGTIRQNKDKIAISGVASAAFRCSAPLIYLATDEVQVADLTTRSLSIKLWPALHMEKDYEKHFLAMTQDEDTYQNLWTLAKTLMRTALRMPEEDAIAMFTEARKKVPKALVNRTCTNVAMMFTGLDFLYRTLAAYDYPQRLLDRLQEIAQATEVEVKETAERKAKEKARNDVDFVLEDMSIMALEGKDLQRNLHFVVEGNRLLLNALGAYPRYMMHCHHMRKAPEFTKPQSFVSALQTEECYLGSQPDVMNTARTWLVISLDVLKQRGTDVSGFF